MMSEPMLLPSPPPSRNGRLYPGDLAPRQYLDTPPAPQPSSEEEEGPLFITLRLLRRHKGVLILAGALGTIVGVLMTLPQQPIYQAMATIEIQGINTDFLNMHNLNATVSSSYDPMLDIQTQIREMQSRVLTERVVAKIRDRQRETLSIPVGRLAAWRKVLHLGDTAPPSLDDALASASINIRASTTSRIVDIMCDSISPLVSAEFANTVAEEYQRMNVENRIDSTQKTEEFLNHTIEDLRVKLERSEDNLQTYMNGAGLMLINGEKDKENVAEERLRSLQSEMVKAQGDRVQKQAHFERVKASSSDSLPEILDDKVLIEENAKLGELRRQMADMDVSLTPANPKVRKLQASIDSVEKAIKESRKNIVERLENEFQSAKSRETMLEEAYAQQKTIVSEQASKLVHYGILKREVDTNRQIFQSMLERVKETGIVSAMKATGIRMVDRAEPPSGPYKPNTMRSAIVGMMCGLFFGALFVLVRDRANRDLQQPGDASFYLNLPELGVIPSFSSDPALRRSARAATPENSVTNAEQEAVELVTWNRKFSSLAESFRSMLTSVLFSGHHGTQPHVIVLTSANPSEGKTTVTINLAIALAEINQRVLLIDADMRRPRLQNLFNLGAGPGLADLLREKSSPSSPLMEGAISQTSIPGLYVMRSGRSSGIVSNLLHSSRLPELIERLRTEFDTIVIDTPPVLHISDARVIGRLADAVLLIVRAGATTRDAAIMVKQRFGEDGTPILGTILNGWDPRRHESYRYRYYNGTAAQYYRKDASSEQE